MRWIVIYACLFVLWSSVLFGQEKKSLEDRVAELEKQLGSDIPTNAPISPEFLKPRAADKEKNKESIRRRKLYQHINNQLDYHFVDTNTAEVDIYESWLLPDDGILKTIIEEYKKSGWAVEHVPGARDGNGYYKFKINQ